MDDWHHPRAVRMRRGDESPEGYYYDSFDVEALTSELLKPFRTGAATVRTASYDHVADHAAMRTARVPAAAAVLIVDGVFLLRPAMGPDRLPGRP